MGLESPLWTFVIIFFYVILLIIAVVSYRKTRGMLEAGIFLDGKIEIIRKTLNDQLLVNLRYVAHGKRVKHEITIIYAEMNEDYTVHLVVDGNNRQKYRLLPASKPMSHPMDFEIVKRNKTLDLCILIALSLLALAGISYFAVYLS